MVLVVKFTLLGVFVALISSACDLEAQAATRKQSSQNASASQTFPDLAALDNSMTLHDRVSRLEGERVILLLRNSDREVLQRASENHLAADDRYVATLLLPNDKYDRRTGTVVDAKVVPVNVARIIVALDGDSERVVLFGKDTRHLGFIAELDFARSLIGRSLWVRRRAGLAADCVSPKRTGDTIQPGVVLTAGNMSRLTLSRVEWGDGNDAPGKIVLFFRTEEGTEGCYLGSDDKYYVLNRYRLYDDRERDTAYTDPFLRKDPRKSHPDWSSAVWKRIANMEIVVGMTEAQAKLACGGTLTTRGVELSSTGKEVIGVNQCTHDGLVFGPRFVLENGRVTRLLQRR